MAADFTSKYAFELWSPSGVLLADLTGIAFNRKLTKSRNIADTISFMVDLNRLEDYAKRNFIDPQAILTPRTEVRVRRGQKYLSGGFIDYMNTTIDDHNQQIEVRCSGFLEFFNARYTDDTRIFTATQATTIAWTLINESQALTNGNLGVTQGLVATVGPHDRTYQRTNIKTALQDLTQVQTNPFDFEFTESKVFNTYTQIGSNRPDVVFEFPYNIKAISIPNDASQLANEIIALGSGSGTFAGLKVVVDNIGSQLSYSLNQKIYTDSSVIDSGTLTDNANAELASWSNPNEVPTLTIDANQPPYITDYGIGDTVQVKINNHSYLSHINSLYRVEKFDLTVDDNDNEIVTLYVSA